MILLLAVVLVVDLASRIGTVCTAIHSGRTRIAVAGQLLEEAVLFAADNTVSLTVPVPVATAAAAPTTDTNARTITGMVLPYGETGDATVNGEAHQLVAGPTSVRLPADLSRIKLVDQHQQPPRPIGYATAAENTPDGLRMTFRVGNTPEGDRALLEASEHLADAFSVELSQLQLNGAQIADSLLSAVALLGIPAFASARVASVTAALNTNTRGTTMTPEQRARLAELLAMSGRTAEQEAEFQQLTQLAVTEAAQTTDPQQQPQPQPQQPPAGQAAAGASTLQLGNGQTLQLDGNGQLQLLAGQPAGQLAAVPAAFGDQQPQATGTGRPLGDLYAAMARVARGESRAEAEAALADITVTANPYVAGADGYAGRLWQGLDYTRKFVPLMRPGELTSWKGNGWRWNVAPQVADYAGDKAAVTSNAATTTNAPWTAARLAGAHDIDRKFRDFGDEEFMQAYYEAMTLDYALKSDQKARAWIIANATAGAAAGAVGLLRAAAIVAARVNSATNDAGVDYVLCNDVDKIGLLATTAASVPAFLADFLNIDPGKFIGTSAVPAGTVIAGNKNAGEFKELGGVPIRVEVVNITNGGIDGGLFGYYATLLHMAGAIQSATWT
jgi:hypothetical protein